MAKRLAGKTLTYDATDEVYLETEIYMSDDPADTVELRIVDGDDPPFEEYQIDEGSGPWRRIIQPREEPPGRDEPFVLEERHKKVAETADMQETVAAGDDEPQPSTTAFRPAIERKPRRTTVVAEATSSDEQDCWLRVEADVDESGRLRVPEQITRLARDTGGPIELRVRISRDHSSGDCSSTLDGLPTIGDD